MPAHHEPRSTLHSARSGDPRERLLRTYARTRRPADLERLVIAYRPLARALARRSAASPQLTDDLEQAAYEGLIKAIRRFDPHRGCAFTSFAVPTILGEVRRYRRDTAWTSHVPRPVQDRVRAIRTVGEAFEATHGCAATTRQLASALRCSEEDVVDALTAASSLTSVPLDGGSTSESDGGYSLADRIGADDPGFEQVECLTTIETGIRALRAEDKTVLRLHFAEDLTQREIARRLGVTRSEVSTRLGRGIERLRTAALAEA